MRLKTLELSDLVSDLTESSIDPQVWYVIREKPPILAIQDHGMAALCKACKDEALVVDQFKAMVDFLVENLYRPGELDGKPVSPILN